MTDARWERVREVFSGAVEEAPTDRDEYVARACEGEPEVAAEVGALLRAHASAGAFLDAPAAEALDVDAVGPRVGPYRILGELGRGGMGTVYRGRRDDALYLKDVALKLVPVPLATHLIGGRLRRERVILGRLEHPNIARLLDGGTTEDGRPYFAMELVEGSPIDEHCRRERLDLRRRLELFRVVCGAVAYAHRNLVVHRDLKSANVFVTRDGTPKLLDFGIAKLLEPDDPEATGLTETGMRPMTPECASPEQVAGGAVTTATDVYALGVLLYRLVSGRPPYTLATRSPEEILRVVCRQEPPPPSRAVDGAHELRPGRDAADLDTIVLKALRKEPERRYPSADEMSEDLRRYLAGEPVRARKDSLPYRARRFVGRHRAGVAAAVVVVASLVAGLGVSLHQAHLARLSRERAVKRSRDAQRLANSLVFELHDAIEDVPGTTRARALVLQRASAMLDTLAQDAPDDPALAEDLAAAYHQLGKALGAGGVAASLDQGEAGVTAHRKGLALRTRLAVGAPDDAARQRALAESDIEMSYALGGPEATRHARQAVERADRLAAAAPGDEAQARQSWRALYALGAAQVAEGDLRAATASFERVAATADARLSARPDDARAAQDSTLAHRRLGAILAKQDRLAEALAHYRQIVPRDEARLAREPDSVEARRGLSVSLVDLGWALHTAGESRAALAHYQRALDIREALLRADPANVQARRLVGSVLERLGGVLGDTGEPLGALEHFERTRRVLGSEETDPELWASLHRSSSEAQAHLRRFPEALASARAARDAHARLVAKAPAKVWLKTGLARSCLAEGGALLGLAGAARPAPAAVARLRLEASSAYAEALRLATELQAASLLPPGDATIIADAQAGLRRSGSSAAAR